MEAFTLAASDGATPIAYRSLPACEVRAIVQLAHGMAEHVPRYRCLASALNAAGYAVYGGDHRGHGASASVHGLGDFGEGGFQAVVDDMAVLSAVAKAWAGEKVHKGQIPADAADRYVKELRAEESYFDLVDVYREHIRTTLPAA